MVGTLERKGSMEPWAIWDRKEKWLVVIHRNVFIRDVVLCVCVCVCVCRVMLVIQATMEQMVRRVTRERMASMAGLDHQDLQSV